MSRDLTFIDCDVHQRITSPRDLYPYLPRAYREDIDLFGLRMPSPGYLNGGAGGWRYDARPKNGGIAGGDLDTLREQLLDKYDVEYAILLGQEIRPCSTLPDADYAAALAAAYNDWMIEEWLAKDARLKGAMLVATQDPKQAAKEIRRVGPHPDIVEVLVSNGARFPYGQRYYDPIFEACVELGLPFALHTGSEGTGINPPPWPVGHPSYYVEHRQARPMGYQAHLTSMVFEGLFERYPTLNVVFVEGGFTWLPTFLWRLDSDWRGLRNQTPWVKRPPSEYVYAHCRFTTQPIETPDRPEQMLALLDWMHAERTLMFCTDYPHWDADAPEETLPPLPAEKRRRIFLENARELYRLPVRPRPEPSSIP